MHIYDNQPEQLYQGVVREAVERDGVKYHVMHTTR
jgi:hypothetical protein